MSTGEVQSTNAGQAEVGLPVQTEWHKNASNHLGTQVEIYQRTLKTVSEAFAQQEQSEVILVRHVNEAHAALARVGMSNLNWLSRPENLAALGGILMGVSLAGNDIVGLFCDDGATRKGFTIAWVCTFLVIGFFMYGAGWRQGQLPMPPGHRSIAERIIGGVLGLGERAMRLLTGRS